MNAKFLLASIATATLLTACGGDHAHIKAVDKVAEAEALAKEKAPKAEPVTFEDEGQPTMGGVGGTKNANANNPADSAEHIANDIATANAQAIAHHGQANTATTETKTEEAKPAEGEATAETPAQAEQPAEQPAEAPAEAKPEGEATATAEAPAETKTN